MSKHKGKKSIKQICRATAMAVLAVFIFAQLFIIGLSLFGGTEAMMRLPLYVMKVESDSMAPQLMRGDAVLCSNKPFEEIAVGDIITFYGNGTFITHEVIRVNPDSSLTTKGSANNYTDGRVTKELYVGSVLRKMPVYSFFLRMTETAGGKLAYIATVIVLVLGYPAVKWLLWHITDKYDKTKKVK